MKAVFRARGILAVAAALIVGCGVADAEDSGRSADGGRVAYTYIGRVSLNFQTLTGVVYGYLTHVDGVPTASLFRGAPGETTALLTFRANIAFQPLPPNGDVGGGFFAVNSVLVNPGDFQIYFTGNPNRNWTDPNTFSNGQTVATLTRDIEQFSILNTIALNAASAGFSSSAPFMLGGKPFNFRDLIRNGVTNVTTGPTNALVGTAFPTPTFAFAGYGLAIGN